MAPKKPTKKAKPAGFAGAVEASSTKNKTSAKASSPEKLRAAVLASQEEAANAIKAVCSDVIP